MGQADGGMGMQAVTVRFRRTGPPTPFRSNLRGAVPGTRVVVEGERGLEIGSVLSAPRPLRSGEEALPGVIRMADAADLAREEGNRQLAGEAFRVGRERIAARGLEMQLIDTEVAFERQRILFYFTAPTRVDFRGLVRDLAAVFRTRIDLRQIGVRDEAKLLGGLGSCGRALCCSSYLPDFAPVTIRMAKDQNLSLNPAKISGLCGRLACCLRYEWDGEGGGKESGCRQKGPAS